MKEPRRPLAKEAKEFLQSKLHRMGKIERDKAIKRLKMYDRGFVAKDNKDYFGNEGR